MRSFEFGPEPSWSLSPSKPNLATMGLADQLPTTDAPVRKLLGAMLLNVIQDLRGVGHGMDPKERNHYRKKAMVFVLSREECEWSYLWICAYLGIDPSVLRQRIRRGEYGSR